MRRKILQHILAFFASRIIAAYRPVVIAITGSVGKTSTKEAIFTVVSRHSSGRKTEQNLNTEIGVPLTVIGGPNVRSLNTFGALRAIWKALLLLLWHHGDYPKILVLELAADKPGDIRAFAKWLHPDIAVVTAIGEIPVHVEYYSGPEAVAREKSWIVQAVKRNGTVILNRDDLAVFEMHQKTKAKVVSFGFASEADFRIAEYAYLERSSGKTAVPEGIGFKIFRGGSFVPIRLLGVFGKPQAYAAAAAAAVGETLGINLVEVAEALLEYQPPPGRMRLLAGIKGTFILDDTYNAAPTSTHAALETLESLPGKRKIAVLGDMREIGKFTFEAHHAIGVFAASICDYLLTVGDTANIIAEGARDKGFPRDRLLQFHDVIEAGSKLQEIIRTGDLILVKGSRAMHMERVVEEIMAEPEKAKDLLVH